MPQPDRATPRSVAVAVAAWLYVLSEGRSLQRTHRHSAPSAAGLTQPSSVIPVVRSSDAASGIVTHELAPLNERAPAYLPALDQVALETVPALPLPDQSVTVVPDPSSNEYAATNPVELAAMVVSRTEAPAGPPPATAPT